MENKARGKAEELKGKTKEVAGEETNNPRLAREGRRERRTGALRQAIEKVRDAVRGR
jgi:uncharacterized protein YjbJ (UPF0337 family)